MSPQAPTTEQIRDSWDAIADGFDEHVTPLNIDHGDDALRRAGLEAGMAFLDVAAGSGSLSIPAARRGAHVVATDLSPRMIDRLVARAEAEGLAGIDARVMDGCDLALADDTFDVTASQNGVSLFPDLAGGLAEMVRVTKPGGRVVLIAFGPPPTVEFLGYFLGALQAVVPGFTGLPTDPPPLPFQVADPAVLAQRLAEAGLTDVGVEPVTWDMELRSGGHFWRLFTTSNPIGSQLVADLTAQQRADVEQVLDGMLRERAGGSPTAVLHAQLNIGIGRKAGSAPHP